MFRGVALALVLLEGAAWADDALAQASEAVAASDYLAARAALVTAQVAGEHSPDDTAEMYRLSGIVEAALGNAQAATEAFIRLLALVPKAKLPPGTSPKITRPFDAARSYYTTHAPLDLKIATAAKPPAITLVVVSDPVHLVARARVLYAIDRGPEQTKEVAADGTDIALPAGKRIDARVIALDVHGNRLVEIGSREVPIVIIGEPAPVAVPHRPAPRPPPRPAPATVELPGRPIYLRWWPYAAATVVCAGATAYFGWSAYSDARELQRLSIDHSVLSPEFQSVKDHGQRATLITNIGFGVTGAFALAAGAMFLIRRAHTEVRVTAVPAHAGGALVLGGTF
jgi:hypothetical protein